MIATFASSTATAHFGTGSMYFTIHTNLPTFPGWGTTSFDGSLDLASLRGLTWRVLAVGGEVHSDPMAYTEVCNVWGAAGAFGEDLDETVAWRFGAGVVGSSGGSPIVWAGTLLNASYLPPGGLPQRVYGVLATLPTYWVNFWNSGPVADFASQSVPMVQLFLNRAGTKSVTVLYPTGFWGGDGPAVETIDGKPTFPCQFRPRRPVLFEASVALEFE